MNQWPLLLLAFTLAGGSGAGRAASTNAEFTAVQRLTNREMFLRVTAPTGGQYRIAVSTNLPVWQPLVTAVNAGVNQHTDSAAPYLPARFYRAELLAGTNALTGDHLATTNGDVVIHPLFHASLVLGWNGTIIYTDPDDDSAFMARYQGLPKADLILITHSHGDHYSAGQISNVRGSNAVIIVPQAVYDRSDFAPFRPSAIALPYGASTNVLGLRVEAVPAYNGNHLSPINNAYVLSIGGRRILISGDTGDVPEIRALTNIDVAFLCMNRPFTMTPNEATNSVRAFRPRVVYPYHYRDQSGATTNAAYFKQILGTDLGIEVRLRPWY